MGKLQVTQDIAQRDLMLSSMHMLSQSFSFCLPLSFSHGRHPLVYL